MVVVLPHHAGKIFFPPVGKVVHIVVLGLVDVPVVDILIHHQHSLRIAGVQQGLGAGVVGRADGIVAVFFQDAHLAAHSVRVAHRAQQAVVVVDAGTLQNDPAAVEQQTLPAPGKAADAKAGAGHVGAKGGLQGVELRVLRGPKGRFRQAQPHRHTGFGSGFGQHSGAIQYLQLHGAGSTGGSGDLHLRRVNGHCAHPQTVQQQMPGRAGPQGNRAVYARAGIPAAVGLVGVAGDHLQHIFGIKGQFAGQVHRTIGVSVGVEGQLFAVEPDLGVVVHALKLQGKGLALQGRLRRKALFVQVVKALVPAGVGAAGGSFRARLVHGCVMGQGDRHGRPFFQ